ncbi:MAG: DUF3137 domain-containing protein [Sulfurimonadaceae bacterium]|nr:DUF3137 domain-containing protein [Sulfurimonadaceae bacterium]
MKSISDLTDFYYEELYGDLKELDEQREKIAKKLIFIFIILVIAAAAIMLVIFNESGGFNDGIIFVGFAAAAIGAFIKKFMTADYTDSFKLKIIKPLIHAIEDDLIYTPKDCVSETLFKRSKIFRHRIDRYNGNDLVTGHIDGVKMRFSDVHAEYKTKDSKGRTSWHTIFNGLFIVAEFNKHFKGKTIVLPDQAEKLFGSLIGKWLQSKNVTREKLIKMDDPAFEKSFVVYGSDQIEARYILTHSMMKRLLDFKKRSKENIFISFVGSNIHIAISGGDRFEPAVFKSLLSYKQAMAYIATLKLAIGIVEDLKLNERLWSKV